MWKDKKKTQSGEDIQWFYFSCVDAFSNFLLIGAKYEILRKTKTDGSSYWLCLDDIYQECGVDLTRISN